MTRARWLAVAPLVGLVLFTAVVLVRLGLTRVHVQADLNRLASAVPLDIGSTSYLQVTPLYEGVAAGEGLAAGLGVSYLIRTDGATILLDMGNNPGRRPVSPLQENMEQLGVTLDDVDIVVISHTHADHLGGEYWADAGTFSPAGDRQPALGERPIYVPEPVAYPGSAPILADRPIAIAPGIATTGGLPYLYPFPAWLAIPEGREQALVIHVAGRGLVLVTGCGHMGLESLVAHAQAFFNEPVVGVIGGLHEGSATEQDLAPQIELLSQLDPVIVALSPHDSGPAALAALQEAFPSAYKPIRVGEPLEVQ